MKPQESAIRDANGAIVSVTHNGRTKWTVGKTYAVQPSRNAAQVARMRITRLVDEPVSAISHNDAIAEGYTSREAFFETWQHIHGDNSFDMRVWVITFELVD